MRATHCYQCDKKLDYFDGIICCSACRRLYKIPFLAESERTEDLVSFMSKVPDNQADMKQIETVKLDAKTKSKSMSADDLLVWIQAGGKVESG